MKKSSSTPRTVAAAQACDPNPQPASGHLVRLLRRRKGLTLDHLAVEVGLSKGHLSRYERGEKSLSVSALMRLAKALGTSVAALLGESPQDDLMHVVRAADRIGTQAERAQDGGFIYMPLSRPGDLRSTAFLIRLEHMAVMKNDAYHSGEEMLFVVSGVAEVELATKSVLLRQGDFAQFSGSVHHRLRAMETNTEVLVVVTNMDVT